MPAPRRHKKNAAIPPARRRGKRTSPLPAPARRRKQPGPGPHPQLLCCLGVLEGIADLAVIYDTHSVAAGANSAARRVFGFDPAGMQRSAVIDRLSGRPLPILQPALGGKTVREREYRFRDPRGGDRTVLASTRPVRAERKIIGAQEVWRDVTAQRHLENFLRSSEARYRSLFEESQSYNIVIGPDGTVRDVNRLLLKSLVYHKAEVIGRPFLYFVAPGRKQWALEVLRKATAGKLTHNIDITLRARDGSPRIVMFSPRKITIQEKGIVIGTLFTGLDITERKEAEEALARTNAELETRVEERTAEISRERRRLYNVLETLPAYVILLDRDHRTPFANRIFRERFGVPGDRRCHEYLFGRSEPCENCETFKVLKTNAPHRWEWTGPDGRNYDIHDFPFTDTDGSLLVLEMGIDITKQKQAQESLRSAAQYARSLIEASLDPLVTISPEGKITDVNEATIRATGLSRKNLIGTDFSRYFTEPEKARAGYRQVFATGSVTDYPLTIRHRNGRLMDVLYNASVYRDTGGKMLGVFAAARDVTERKRAEAELEDYRRHLEDLVRQRTAELEELSRFPAENPNPVIRTDGKGTIIYRNPAAGRKIRAWRCRPGERLPPDLLGETRKVFQSGRPDALERREGKTRTYLYFLTSRRGKGYVNIYGMDISQLKRLENAHRKINQCLEDLVARRTQELTQAHRLLERIFSTTKFLLAYLDRDFNFLRVNRAYAEAGGHTPEFFVGKNHFDLYPHRENEEIFRRVRKTGKPYLVHARPFEYPDQSARGTTYWDWSLQPVRDRGNRPTGFLMTLVDVTERTRAEAELLQMQAEMAAAKRLSAIGTIAATVAHELRTPLGTIGLAAANLERKSADPELTRHIENIRRKVFDSDRVISNLLTYTRIKPPRFEAVRLDRLLDEAVETTGERYPRRKVRVRRNTAPLGRTAVKADKVQLLEVFNNVIDNAYQAIDKPAGRIEVGGRIEDGKQAVITIRDNGEGIEQGNCPRVFEPFYSRKRTGTGLGLTLSRELIELHGGTIALTSQKGQGTAVTITLPLRRGS